jgi:hypothetical protein
MMDHKRNKNITKEIRIKVKFSLGLTKYHAMKKYGGLEV